MLQAFKTFADCSALHPGEDDGTGVLGDFDLDEMITADDIDENGDIIGEDDDENDDDEEGEAEGDMEQEDGKGGSSG